MIKMPRRKTLIYVVSLSIGFIPMVAHGVSFIMEGIGCVNNGQCGFCDIAKLISNIFNFLRNNIAMPIAILMIIYGGVMMIFSGGNSKNIQKGQKILTAAVIGFAIVLGVSLIINTVLTFASSSTPTLDNILNGVGWCN